MSLSVDCPFSKEIVERANRILEKTIKKGGDVHMQPIPNHWSIIQDCLFIVSKAKIEGYPQLTRSKQACKQRKYLLQAITQEHFDIIQESLVKGNNLSTMRLSFKTGKVLAIPLENKKLTNEGSNEALVPKKVNIPRIISSKSRYQQEVATFDEVIGTLLQLVSSHAYSPGQLPVTSIYDDILMLAKQSDFDIQFLLEGKSFNIEDLYEQSLKIERMDSIKYCIIKLMQYLIKHPTDDPNTFAMFGSDEDSFEIWRKDGKKEGYYERDRNQEVIKTKKTKESYFVQTNLPELEKIWKDCGLNIDQVILMTNEMGYNWIKIYSDEQYRALWFLTFISEYRKK